MKNEMLKLRALIPTLTGKQMRQVDRIDYDDLGNPKFIYVGLHDNQLKKTYDIEKDNVILSRFSGVYDCNKDPIYEYSVLTLNDATYICLWSVSMSGFSLYKLKEDDSVNYDEVFSLYHMANKLKLKLEESEGEW